MVFDAVVVADVVAVAVDLGLDFDVVDVYHQVGYAHPLPADPQTGSQTIQMLNLLEKLC